MAEINLPQFEEEYKTFKRHMHTWIDGFVVIEGAAVLGPYKTEKKAYEVGAEVFGFEKSLFVGSVVDLKLVNTVYELPSAECRLIPSEPSTGFMVNRGVHEVTDYSKYL